MKTTRSTPPSFSFAMVCDYHENYLGHIAPPCHINCTLVIFFSRVSEHKHATAPLLEKPYKVLGECTLPVSPRSLWSRTWMSVFPGFSSWASSVLSLSAPGSPASACALTDSAWRWPTDVRQVRHMTGEGWNSFSLYKHSSGAQKLK